VRILLVESNSVLAGQFVNTLGKYLVGVEIDHARNPMILVDYIRNNSYDLILADVDSMVGSKLVMRELNNAESIVIVWTFANRTEALRRLVGTKIRVIPKMVSTEEIEEVADILRSTVCSAAG